MICHWNCFSKTIPIESLELSKSQSNGENV